MILSKKERVKLQEAIHNQIQAIKEPSLKNLFHIISALILDFEELENILSRTCVVFASGREVTELLDYLSEILSSELIDKLHFEGQLHLIKSLALLADTARDVKRLLAEMHDANLNIM